MHSYLRRQFCRTCGEGLLGWGVVYNQFGRVEVAVGREFLKRFTVFRGNKLGGGIPELSSLEVMEDDRGQCAQRHRNRRTERPGTGGDGGNEPLEGGEWTERADGN